MLSVRSTLRHFINSWLGFVVRYSASLAAMPSWTTHDVVKEISDVAKMLRSRMQCTTNTSDTIGDCMVKQIVARIAGLPSTNASDCMLLYTAVSECSLKNDHKAMLTTAVDGLASTSKNESANALINKGQVLTTPYMWLTEADWRELPKKSPLQQAHHISSILRRINLVVMKEETKKAWTALMVYFWVQKHGQLPSYWTIYDWSRDLAKSLEDCTTKPHESLPLLSKFPADPRALGAEFLQHAFENQEPVEKSLDGFTNIMVHHTPVRNTSRLLRGGRPSVDRNKSDVTDSNNASTCLVKLFTKMLSKDCSPEQPDLRKPTKRVRTKSCSPYVPEELSTTAEELSTTAAQPENPFAKKRALERIRLSNDFPRVPAPPKSWTGDGALEAKAPADADGSPAPVAKAAEEPPAKKLEDYEQEAFDKLSKRKRSSGAQALKMRPAAIKAPASKPPRYGCSSCRGSTNGCRSCKNPNFSGKRMTRAEYLRDYK